MLRRSRKSLAGCLQSPFINSDKFQNFIVSDQLQPFNNSDKLQAFQPLDYSSAHNFQPFDTSDKFQYSDNSDKLQPSDNSPASSQSPFDKFEPFNNLDKFQTFKLQLFDNLDELEPFDNSDKLQPFTIPPPPFSEKFQAYLKPLGVLFYGGTGDFNSGLRCDTCKSPPYPRSRLDKLLACVKVLGEMFHLWAGRHGGDFSLGVRCAGWTRVGLMGVRGAATELNCSD